MIKKLTMFVLIFSFDLFAQTIIIDHNCTNISKIPEQWIIKAKSEFHIGYQHTSHGSQIVTGIESFKGNEGDLFNFSSSSWGYTPEVFFNDYCFTEASDLSSGGDTLWANATRKVLTENNCKINVVMWSWCGGVSGTDENGISKYLNKMSELENQFRDIKFIYITGHLDGSGKNGNLNLRNEQIRNYCKLNNKILFDFADIESYDPDGFVNYMEKFATDGCEYDSDGDENSWSDKNWADEWINNNPNDELTKLAEGCGECAHSHRLNCVMKGRAFWWLMARIAGWDGNSITSVNQTNKPNKILFCQNYPNPFNPETIINYQVPELGISNSANIKLAIYDMLGREIEILVDKEQKTGTYSIRFNGSQLSSGIYFYKLEVYKEGYEKQSVTKKLVIIR